MKRCPQCNRVETDEALKFCRVDGATLVNHSSPLDSEAGTARLDSESAATEIETSILPHITDAVMSRGTAPTTVLPAQAAPSTTGKLSKSAPQRKILIAIATLIIIAAGIIFGFIFLSKRNSTIINSIAVMPFVNESGNADVDYLSDGMTETLIGSRTIRSDACTMQFIWPAWEGMTRQ